MKLLLKTISLSVATLALASTMASADTLEKIKKRSIKLWIKSPGLPGFASPDSAGVWTGIDVDVL